MISKNRYTFFVPEVIEQYKENIKKTVSCVIDTMQDIKPFSLNFLVLGW